MKIILVFFLLVSLASADLKINSRGLVDGDKIVFDCTLHGVPSKTIGSTVNPCHEFKTKILNTPGIEVEVTLLELEDIDELVQFSSEYKDFIKILNLNLFYFPEKFSSKHLTRVFALVPNLTRLEITWDNIPGIPEMIIDDHEAIFLPNLKTLAIKHQYDTILLNFLSKFLPKHTLHELDIEIDVVYSPDAVTQFIESQKNIKILKIHGNPKSADYFKSLKLEKFDCNFGHIQRFEDQGKFLTEFVQSHPELVDLDVIGVFSNFMNDELFTEMCKRENLKNFEFYVDNLSPAAIGELKNLKNLKSFKIAGDSGFELEKINEVAKLEMPGIESIHFNIWKSFPSEVYEQFAQNYPNLKSLEIQIQVDQNLNFFMKTFPRLEKLSLELRRDGYETYKFEEAYKNDGLKHENLKSLSLIFDVEFMVDTDLLTKLLESLPNLEELKLFGAFYFTPESLRSFLNTKLKRISVSLFRVPCEEDYSGDIIEILKEFDEKYETVIFEIGNEEKHVEKGWSSCLHLNDGKWTPRSEEKEKIDFGILIKALRDDFSFYARKNARSYLSQDITIRGGKKPKTA